MRTTGVHHVSLNVRDADEAHHFYVGVMGFTERSDRPDFPFAGHWFDVGDQGHQLHTLEIADTEAPEGQHFAVAVDDLEEAITTLADRGVSCSTPSDIAGICRQAFLRDPTGNLIELNQRVD